jgi:predicted DNA-binding protein (UPF0251 family)
LILAQNYKLTGALLCLKLQGRLSEFNSSLLKYPFVSKFANDDARLAPAGSGRQKRRGADHSEESPRESRGIVVFEPEDSLLPAPYRDLLPAEREAIELQHDNEMTLQEIADQMKVSKSTVHNLIKRGIEKMRKKAA